MAGHNELRPISPEPEDHEEVVGDGTVGAQGVGNADAGAQEGEDDEGRPPAQVPTPHQPTTAEREEHEITHTPYRSWCRYCVQGRGRRSPHRSQDPLTRSNGVPKISLDYFFLSEADQEASANPVLGMLEEFNG